MNIKKIIAASIIAGILGLNYAPLQTFAITQKENTKITKNKKQSKKELKAQQEKVNKINYINIEWWEDCNDEYLSAYIYKAIANNYNLKIASLRVEESRQLVKLQLSSELPKLSAGVSPAVYKLPGVTNTTGSLSIPIIASYEADIFLKNHDKTKSAKKIYEATKLNEKATYIAIASQVGATYYNIVRLDKLIQIQEEIIKDRKQIYELMKLSNNEGIVPTSDLVRAEKAFVAASTDLLELKKQRQVLLNSLSVLIGETPANSNALKRISYDKLSVNKKIPKEISSEVITARPDYLVAQTMLEKAGIDVRVAKKQFLPSLDILGLLGFSANSVTKTMNWENSIFAAGASLLLPIYNGGANVANLRINKNKYQQALMNYQQTNLTSIQEVNDALYILKTDNQKYLTNVKTLAMETKDFKYTEQKYEGGIISYLDVLQQKETLLVIKKLVVNDKTSCIVDHISLYKATAANL